MERLGGRRRCRAGKGAAGAAAAALLAAAAVGVGTNLLIPVAVAAAAARPASVSTLHPAADPPDSGPVYAWGNGVDGEIGDGAAPAAQAVPTLAHLPSGVTAVQVAAGAETSYALGSDGNVYTWGNGTDGELGNGSTTPLQDTPVKVDLSALGGVDPVAVAAGTDMAYLLDADGRVWAFGADGNGELGDGGAGGEELTPVQVPLGGRTIVAIAAGSISGYALDEDGNIWAWGYGVDGQLGNGASGSGEVAARPSPVVDAAGSDLTASAIAAGASDGYAIGTDGNLYAWGDNSNGQLGDGDAVPSSAVPVVVALPNDDGATQIAAGAETVYALDAAGVAYSWGFGDDGELGNGSLDGSAVPVPVTMPAGVSFLEIGASYADAYAIGSNQHVYSWGYDGAGELGNGSVVPDGVATPVPASISGINPGDPPLALGPGPMADTALLIGEGAPAVVVPEVPVTVLLPLVAVLAAAATVLVRRRRASAA